MLRFIIHFGIIANALSSSSIDSSTNGITSSSTTTVSDLQQSVRSLFGLSNSQNKKYKKGERILEYAPTGWLQVQSFPGVKDCTAISQQTTNIAIGICNIDDATSSHILIATGTDDSGSLQQQSFSDNSCTTPSTITTISSLPVTSVCSVDGANSLLTTYIAGATPPAFPYSGSMFSLSADDNCEFLLKQTVINNEYCFSNGYTSVSVVCDNTHPYVTNVYSDTFCTTNQVVSTHHQTPTTCVKSTEPQYTYGSALRSCYDSNSVTVTRALRGV